MLLALIYFFTYLILITLVFLNLFVAIILNGYFETRDQQSAELNADIFEGFKDAWSKFDHDATGLIETSQFTDLMFEIGKPLGWDESYRDNPGL